jgi:hypothetical protein
MDGQFICSGLVSRATAKYIAGYPRSPEDMMPADLAYFWGAESEEPIPAPGVLGRFLNLLPLFVDLFRRTKSAELRRHARDVRNDRHRHNGRIRRAAQRRCRRSPSCPFP